ncbi:MAG: DNA-directed RNA polymerase subunit L [Candidatus Thermoplasmatota archaeon]|jgi:DNA-directed RNA polymerase subunit L|nr:DNA-directed RNA polymerase subunit L [Candidatus Thermoplasmatota archaeon]MCL6089517.1 DNA-directed RNA polymerase subunit L [Candidatus Thermoplasmatota archaeon]
MNCQLRVINKEKNSITLEMLNYDNTILRPLIDEILKDDQVEETRYYIKHPIIDNPEIYIRVKTGKPQAAVKRSIRRLSKVFETLETDLIKEIKRLEESN